MKSGYAASLTGVQTCTLQLAAFDERQVQNGLQETTVYREPTKRPDLFRRLNKLKHGDKLVVWKRGRLGRSLRDLIAMIDD
jgi:DNA invertase Pin-like site-specific DNA recombinase